MKKVISLIGTLLFIASVNAQSPVGKWKLVSGVTESVTGKSTDIMKGDYEKEPCMAKVIYIFSADGKINTNADHCPESTRKTLEASDPAIKWETSGNKKIIISTKDNDIDPITYDLNIFFHTDLGKRVMTWVLIFGNDPDDRNPEKVKRLIFTYYEL